MPENIAIKEKNRTVFSSWRENELSRDEVAAKYPEMPKLVLLKIDLNRRGVIYTDRACAACDPDIHYLQVENIHNSDSYKTLEGFLLRDGSCVCKTHRETPNFHREPYIIDYVDGKFVVIDEGKIIEEIFPWEKPDFLDKVTSNGTPMRKVARVRAQRFEIHPNLVCHYWDNPKDGCKYCGLFALHRKDAGIGYPDSFYQDIAETAIEAFKQKGRYANVHMTAGSILSGNEIFDDELEVYIKSIQAVGRAFKEQWIPMQIVSSAFNERQLKRLKNETGITTYDTDMELLDEELFNWICPGKARTVGHKEWKRRLFAAVDIFGKNHVNTGIVVGVEQAKPNGYRCEDEAYEETMKAAEEITSHDVALTLSVWHAVKGSVFYRQLNPSLEYYVRLTLGFAELHRKYKLHIIPDDYRRCGNHMNMDLDRLMRV
jgi:sugar phosphate isomerase/epimerase